jgi:hypothetical protein
VPDTCISSANSLSGARKSALYRLPSAFNTITRLSRATLRAFLPKAAVVRVDRDSTAHKNDWADLYRRIADNEIDILVGTQMLAKGHDFARLNLVINADDGSLGQEGAQGFFDTLRAVADGGQVLVAAVGAFERDGFAMVAVVAAEF